MNGRLKIIEQQLLGIDSAAFQNLCDVYLALRERDLISINRTGSQFGKQKTIKGTPDTFFRLDDGSLRYVEYTTQVDGLVGKIITDIDKCLDTNITGISTDQDNKIIICFNSKLNVTDETAITQHAVSKKIRIELIGLDWLALEIYSKYLILAKDILGIPLDTGQLLPIPSFIEEYNSKGGNLSTPIDNIFLHRKSELTDIESKLATNDLLIISGFPGVGKTKIALEALNIFLAANKDYSVFVVSKKDQDISEDLKIHLQQAQNYILLVDDANRQLTNFKQILGIFKENRKGNIKLLITVRDYALTDVTNECFDFLHHVIKLNKFNDEEITQLISSEPFEIKNPKYQKRIVEIADGNARLAVMASRLAKQEQVGFLYGDGERIFELYDYYFKTFIKDFDIFGNKVLIRTLGIISFFFSVDRSNKELLENILKEFEIDYYEFNEAIDELEKRELVEVKYNNARVSEQVMATYFFYKVFIKDEILSFKTLLFAFFPIWEKRFSDTIIPSNNSFGYESVLSKISGTLNEYLYSVYLDEKKVLAFFSIFWFYKREEVLNYFHQRTIKLPEPENPTYSTKYENNDFVWERDKTLDFLADLFDHFTESFIPSIVLAFEYCRKKPDSLPELIRRIREKLLFDDDDHRYDFKRQVELFNLLIENFQEKKQHYVKAFFALAESFLSHNYQITKGGRNHTVTFYQYPLPFYDVTKEFRKTIWLTLFENYETYPDEVFSVIKHFKPGYNEAVSEILEFDLSLLIPFIENNLDHTNFKHIHFINEFIVMLDREKLTDRNYQNLKTKFNSKDYEDFRKIDWNTIRGKQDYDFEKYEDFEKLKEQDVRTSFLFQKEIEFTALNTAIRNTLSLEDNNNWGIDRSLNIIIEENFLRNEELGFKLLENILMNYPEGINPLHLAIKTIVNKSSEWSLRLWNLIKGWDHENKLYWQLSFFDYLPFEFTNYFYRSELLLTIGSIEKYAFLQFESYEKFISIKSDKLHDRVLGFLIKIPKISRFVKYKEKNIFEEILSIAYQKIEKEKIVIKLSFHFFEKYSKMFEANFDLLSKSYIQQERQNNHFDLHRTGLKTLIQINPQFIIEYIKTFYTDKENLHNRDTYNELPFIWDLENHETIVEKVANMIVENSIYLGILEHPLIILFHNLNVDQMTKAKQFLLNYISKYYSDHNKINSVIDIVRHIMNDFYEEVFLHYLSLNTDIENFKKIWWRGNGGSYSGDVIMGDIEAKDWQRILTIVDKAKNQLDLIPIRTYIKNRIESELRRGEYERKRKFVSPDGW